jgi:16S rRNA (guanine966-N2)-methyltransferase
MRVIAGRYRGRRLRAPRGTVTRPTSERVREGLFSMLGALDGARVLDLFAGTGALGIEALSRGAEQVVFVERDRRAVEALRANLAALELDEEQALLRREDAHRAVKTAREQEETYDLLLIDPPYGRVRELGPELSALLAPGGRLVAESDRRAPPQLQLALVKERRYGDTEIRIYRQE